MSLSSDRARRAEKRMAAAMGTERIANRPRYQRAPDAVPIRLADGTVLMPESKARGKLPKWLLAAVAQARGYLAGAVPVVVLTEHGAEQFALVPLDDFMRIAGVQPKAIGQLLLGANAEGGTAP